MNDDLNYALACLGCLERIAVRLERERPEALRRADAEEGDIAANIEALADHIRLELMKAGAVEDRFIVCDTITGEQSSDFVSCEEAAQVAENLHASTGRKHRVRRSFDNELMYTSKGPVD